MLRILGSLACALCTCVAASAQAPLSNLIAHDNRVPAGTLRDGVLTLDLRVVRGIWRPDRDTDPGLEMIAFGESGKAASIPGPLIRVQQGTQLRVRVRNETDSAIVLFGLSGARTRQDTAVLAIGAAREFMIQAKTAGNFLYGGQFLATAQRPEDQRYGEDRLLAGAFIVDEPGARVNDRVLVLGQLVDSKRVVAHSASTVDEVLTINGKSWPHTERMTYDLGETIRWRVLNASYDVHPMHLHGFYFNVLSRGDFDRDSLYLSAQVRKSVTERMAPFTTMTMEWTPDRPGNWLFHCHLTFHILPHGLIGDAKASGAPHRHPENHALEGMAGLVLGTTIRERGTASRAEPSRHQIRLFVHQRDSIPGQWTPPFGFALQTGTTEPTAAQMTIPGPPLILRRGQPTAITVVNRTSSPTSVHWHGVELESYYDGVSGFGGVANRISPAIAPGDSFLVRVTPPRAGTFIYHSHFEEVRQQLGGMFGAFIVLEPNEVWDPEHDRQLIISTPPFGDPEPIPVVNGDTATVITLRAGETYRLRLINITLERPNISVSLVNGEQPVEWELLAKDGAALPAAQAGKRLARLKPSIGETYDVRFKAAQPGELQLQIHAGNGNLLRTTRVIVR